MASHIVEKYEIIKDSIKPLKKGNDNKLATVT